MPTESALTATASERRSPTRLVGFGSFVFDLDSCELHRGTQRVVLADRAARVLSALLEQPGHLVRKDELLEEGWGDTIVSEQSLTEAVFLIRQALGDSSRSPQYLETVRGRGFRFLAEVRPVGTRNTPSSPGRGWDTGRHPRLVAIAAVGALIAPASASWSPPLAEVVATVFEFDEGVQAYPSSLAVAPNGRHVAYRADRHLVVQSLTTGDRYTVPDTDAFPGHVFFSSDSRSLGWVNLTAESLEAHRQQLSPRRQVWTLWSHEIGQDTSAPLCGGAFRVEGRGDGAWIPDGRIIVAAGWSGLHEFGPDCATQRKIPMPSEESGSSRSRFRRAVYSPRTRSILYEHERYGDGGISGRRMQLAATSIESWSIDDGAVVTLVRGARGPRPTSDGGLLFETLAGIQYAEMGRDGSFERPPWTVLQQAERPKSNYPFFGAAVDEPILVYAPDETKLRRLYLVAESGTTREISPGAGYYTEPHFSPDGEHLLYQADGMLRKLELSSGRHEEVSRVGGRAHWGPHGESVLVDIFDRDTGHGELVQKWFGGGQRRLDYDPTGWSTSSNRAVELVDGDKLLVEVAEEGANEGEWVDTYALFDLSSGGLQMLPPPQDGSRTRSMPSLSPDRSWIAYVSGPHPNGPRWRIALARFPSMAVVDQLETDLLCERRSDHDCRCRFGAWPVRGSSAGVRDDSLGGSG